MNPRSVIHPDAPSATSTPSGLVRLERHTDELGWLHVAQVGGALPFVARRFFLIGGVPEGTVRGRHGHRSLHQLFVALRGRVRVELAARGAARQVVLADPGVGLHVSPGVWSTQQYFDDGMLLVLSSGEYDPTGYFFEPHEASGDIGHD
jgi:hypothetical protein